MKVAFQGVKGAYSELAALDAFGANIETLGRAHSEEVVQSVLNEDVTYGILPIENSIIGSVTVNLDLFYEYPVFAFIENFIEIKHFLLGTQSSDLQNIKSVYSHPVALDQCRNFLKEYGIKPIATYDTAGAAKMVAEQNDPHQAAICSSLCEKYYNLQILAPEIQNVQNNFTRFLSFAKTEKAPVINNRDKTTIAFLTKNHPGALVNCLNEFSNGHINLTKIESRPIPDNPFEYIFYVDFGGSIDMKSVQTVLTNLKRDAKTVKIIGSYHRGQQKL